MYLLIAPIDEALTVFTITICKSSSTRQRMSEEREVVILRSAIATKNPCIPALLDRVLKGNTGILPPPCPGLRSGPGSQSQCLRASVTLHSNRGLVPLPFQHCPRFHCKVIALKSRTFVVKSRTKFPRKFVRGLNAMLQIVPSPAPAVSRLNPREQLPEN